LSVIKDKIKIINKINTENKVSLIDKLNISFEAKKIKNKIYEYQKLLVIKPEIKQTKIV